MKTRTKIILTIAAAVGYHFLFHAYFDKRPETPAVKVPYADDTTLPMLKQWYGEYNDQYFNGKLPQAEIDMNLRNGNMAETSYPAFKTYHISFDPRYIPAQRVARITLLHEMCHVKTWGETMDDYHGPRWRVCMLGVDIEGGFRNAIIDGYRDGIE